MFEPTNCKNCCLVYCLYCLGLNANYYPTKEITDSGNRAFNICLDAKVPRQKYVWKLEKNNFEKVSRQSLPRK